MWSPTTLPLHLVAAFAVALLNSSQEELRELCSYFDIVRAAEIHPTRVRKTTTFVCCPVFWQIPFWSAGDDSHDCSAPYSGLLCSPNRTALCIVAPNCDTEKQGRRLFSRCTYIRNDAFVARNNTTHSIPAGSEPIRQQSAGPCRSSIQLFSQCGLIFPSQNFGFVRLATHEAALAAITHLHGTQLHGRVGYWLQPLQAISTIRPNPTVTPASL